MEHSPVSNPPAAKGVMNHATAVEPPGENPAASVSPPPSPPPNRPAGEDLAERFLRLEQLRVADTYASSLRDVDQKIIDHIKMTTQKTEAAFTTSLVMSGLVFVVGLVLVMLNIYAIWLPQSVPGQPSNISLLGFACGLLILVLSLTRSPLKNTRNQLKEITSLNLSFLGYIRKIYLIDAMLKNTMLTVNPNDGNKWTENIQDIQNRLDQTIDEFNQMMEDFS